MTLPAAGMAESPRVSIADAIRAAHALGAADRQGQVDAEGVQAVVAALGAAQLGIPEPRDMVIVVSDDAGMPDTLAVAVPTSTSATGGAPMTEPHRPDPRRRTLVERLPPVAAASLPQVDGEPLDPPPTELERVGYRPPVAAPRVRAALGRLLRRPRPGRRLDVPRTVAALARRRASDRLVFEVEQSLSRGAFVVADIGPTMTPFLDDVDHLVERIEQVAGAAEVRTFWCTDGNPPPPSEFDRAADELRPVLVISDLGWTRSPTARSAGSAAWRQALPDGAVALVPHRATRLGRIATVAWDDLPVAARRRSGRR